jgi:hypothetical protein
MAVSRAHKARMRARYAHLYAPEALARLLTAGPTPPRVRKVQPKHPPGGKLIRGTLAHKLTFGEPSLPRGATLVSSTRR